MPQAVTDSGTTRFVSATPKRCIASQKSSDTPAATGGQQFTLTPYGEMIWKWMLNLMNIFLHLNTCLLVQMSVL